MFIKKKMKINVVTKIDLGTNCNSLLTKMLQFQNKINIFSFILNIMCVIM